MCTLCLSMFMLCECVCLWSWGQHSPGQCNVSDGSGSLPILHKYTRLPFTSVTFIGLYDFLDAENTDRTVEFDNKSQTDFAMQNTAWTAKMWMQLMWNRVFLTTVNYLHSAWAKQTEKKKLQCFSCHTYKHSRAEDAIRHRQRQCATARAHHFNQLPELQPYRQMQDMRLLKSVGLYAQTQILCWMKWWSYTRLCSSIVNEGEGCLSIRELPPRPCVWAAHRGCDVWFLLMCTSANRAKKITYRAKAYICTNTFCIAAECRYLCFVASFVLA